ncbi:MAG: GNAT family N-acetyltransferase [Thermoleophilaceae bacterium]|nr:GNAT family N-acetyltransferase [Thermoleophilaceae bacterium]
MVRVWRAEAGEAEVVAGLLGEFRDWLGLSRPSAESLVAGVGRLIEQTDTEYLLGSAGSEPAGVCQLRFRFGVWHAAEDCWLEDLFVREDRRRSGLGAALVEAALGRARKRGCARVELDVNEANSAALALYERFGFGARSDSFGGRDLLMRLPL